MLVGGVSNPESGRYGVSYIVLFVPQSSKAGGVVTANAVVGIPRLEISIEHLTMKVVTGNFAEPVPG